MERGLVMVGHALVIGVVLYAVMVWILKQDPRVAEDRSILVAGIVLVYMVLFGHGLPNTINRNIYSR